LLRRIYETSLKDHIVSGRPMLPGVAHLSIAAQLASNLTSKIPTGITNLSWIIPLTTETSDLCFEVLIETHSNGCDFKIETSQGISSSGTIEFNELQSLNKPFESTFINAIGTDKLYDFFKESGIEYGPFFRGIEELSLTGEGKCCTKIRIGKTSDLLKTNLLDSAFQSSLGLSLAEKNETLLPFSIGKMTLSPEFYNKEETLFFVETERQSPSRVNLKIYNSQHQCILEIQDLGVRIMEKTQDKNRNLNELELHSQMVFTPQWKPSLTKNQTPHLKPITILYFPNSDAWAQRLNTLYPQSQLHEIAEEDDILALINKLRKGDEIWLVDANQSEELNASEMYKKAELTLYLLQKLNSLEEITLKLISKCGITLDPYSPEILPVNSMLLGLVQTAAKEFHNCTLCPISLDRLDEKHVELIVNENNQDNPLIEPVIYSNGMRYIRSLIPANLPLSSHCQLKIGGCYLIIGGLGGLGYMLSTYLAKNYKAKLVLIGRKEPDSIKIKALEDAGAEVRYRQVDILDYEQLSEVLRENSNINGIFHSALELEDRTINLMTKDTLFKVLDPKVKGVINLAKALADFDYPLDFVLFFSSLQSFIANPGQANYTAACVYKDALSSMLRNFYMYNTKVINWGFWGTVGIVSNDKYRERMKSLGIGSIEPNEGLQIIEDFLNSNLTQIAVIKATKDSLSRLNVHTSDVLDDIVPPYIENDPQVAINVKAQNALEQYSRYAVKQVKLPDQVLPVYNKLIQAIHNISNSTYVNKETLLSEFPAIKSHIKLLDHCLEKYPEVLSGELDHMSVLFPNGTFDLVEPIYRDNPTSDYFNQIVAKIMQRKNLIIL